MIHRDVLEKLLERGLRHVQANVERAATDRGLQVAQQGHETLGRRGAAGVHLKHPYDEVHNVKKRGSVLRRIKHHLGGELSARPWGCRSELHAATDLLNSLKEVIFQHASQISGVT